MNRFSNRKVLRKVRRLVKRSYKKKETPKFNVKVINTPEMADKKMAFLWNAEPHPFTTREIYKKYNIKKI